MAITVTRSRVKEKCGISGTDYDSTIDNLIDEQVPVIEYAIRDEVLADSSAGLQATLELGATEIVCGEFMGQRLREPGAADEVCVGEVSLKPFRGVPHQFADAHRLPLGFAPGGDASDPFCMRALGWRRLRPYLKVDPAVPVVSEVLSGGDRSGLEEPL